MRPIERSNATQLPDTTPEAPMASPAVVCMPQSPSPTRVIAGPCARFLKPPAESHDGFAQAWEGVEDTLFEMPLDEVRALGADWVESHLARADVTQAVQRLAPWLKAAALQLAPHNAVSFPALDQYQEAVHLVHAFLYTYAADPALANQVDYAQMCRFAKPLSEAFTRLGRVLARDDKAAAKPLLRTFAQRWVAFRHYQLAWQRSLIPATWTFEAERLELSEAQVHAVLLDPRSMLHTWRNMPILQAQLHFNVCVPPRSFALALDVLKDMHTRLLDIRPDCAAILADALDVDELQRRDERGVLDASTLFRCCAKVAEFLPRQVWSPLLYRGYAEADYPEHKLPEAMVKTYESLLLAYNVDHQNRLEHALPRITDEGVAWERRNFAELLRQYGGHLVRTDAWLSKTAGYTGGSLQERHARALSDLLLGTERFDEDTLPETLKLAAPKLKEAAKVLTQLTEVKMASQHFAALARVHRVALNPSDVARFQDTLFAMDVVSSTRPLTYANAVLDAAVELFEQRGREVERAALARVHLTGMMQDLIDMESSLTRACRAGMAQTFAACLLKAPLHDATGRDTTVWQRHLETVGRDMARVALIDVQVHGAYYAQRWRL